MPTGTYKRKKNAAKKKLTATTKKPAKRKIPTYNFAIWKPPYQEKTVVLRSEKAYTQAHWKEMLDTAVRFWKRLAETPEPYLNTKAVARVKSGPTAWMLDYEGIGVVSSIVIDTPEIGALDTALYIDEE